MIDIARAKGLFVQVIYYEDDKDRNEWLNEIYKNSPIKNLLDDY
jgi:hypothetical protein